MYVLQFWEIILWYCFTLFFSVLTFWNFYYWILMLYLYTKHKHDEAVHWESFGRIGTLVVHRLKKSCTAQTVDHQTSGGLGLGQACGGWCHFLFSSFSYRHRGFVPVWLAAAHLRWFSYSKVWVYFLDLLIIFFFLFLRETVTLVLTYSCILKRLRIKLIKKKKDNIIQR